MLNQFSRTQLLLGESAMQELANKRVAVFGIGGVGGYACEALVRSGIGAFDLIDDDKVCLTNLNRQIIATRKTVGIPTVFLVAIICLFRLVRHTLSSSIRSNAPMPLLTSASQA